MSTKYYLIPDDRSNFNEESLVDISLITLAGFWFGMMGLVGWAIMRSVYETHKSLKHRIKS